MWYTSGMCVKILSREIILFIYIAVVARCEANSEVDPECIHPIKDMGRMLDPCECGEFTHKLRR